MRMNLKNRNISKKLKLKMTSKNLFIFLISLSIVGIILGIIFFYLMSSNDQELVNRVVEAKFKLKDSYNYLEILKKEIISNTYNTVLIWILGISIIGIVGNIIIYFLELFSIGFTISSIISIYKSKSILGIISYLFPTKIIYIVAMFILTYFSIKFSCELIETYFFNKNNDIKGKMRKYFKVLIFIWIIMIGISILNTFIDPIIIKLFTNV